MTGLIMQFSLSSLNILYYKQQKRKKDFLLNAEKSLYDLKNILLDF